MDAEREGRTGLAALGGFAAWRVPWSLLIALRFARMRRSLCYAAGRVPPDRLQSLYAAVAGTTARMNASNHPGAWEAVRVRGLLKTARHVRPWRRRWPMLVIPLILMLPSLLFLGVGSFTSTKSLQEWFTTGNGPRILLWFGIAALAWTVLLLALLLRAWHKARQQPLAEIVALIRLRVWAAAGSLVTGGLLLFVHYRQGEPLDGDATGSVAMLLSFLEDLDLYVGIAFTILALFGLLMLFPPAGLALAGGGVAAGAAGTLGVAEISALGVSGVALVVQGGQNSGGGSYNMPSQPQGGGGGRPPQWLRDKWKRGDQFNRDNWHRYPANEITLENGKRLDSYRPNKEIVSRKYTQISKITKDTFKGYIREIGNKYKEGTKIPDTVKARKEYPDLINKPLRGRYYLEVPVQSKPVPKWALDDAANHDVIIRDVQGHIYK